MNTPLLVAAAPVALAIAACSSPNVQEVRSSAPVVYVQSLRAPDDISSCLRNRLGGLRANLVGGTTELTIGNGSENYAWLITLTPTDAGSVVKVQKSAGDSDSVPEPEMRFDIARCTT
jgi:hypothetical protein